MKHIVRIAVVAVVLASLLGSSPLLAQRVKEPDVKPAPVDNDPWYCGIVCLVGSYFGCVCGGATDPTACLRGCQEVLYTEMGKCAKSYQESDPEYANCIRFVNEWNDRCQATCRQ